MKILFVTQFFLPEMGATGPRVFELSRHWVEAGHEVTVLTGFPNFPSGVVHPQYRSRMRRLIYRELMEGVKVVRTWLLPGSNRRPVERMFSYSSFCFSSWLTGCFLSRPDVIIATSPQLLAGVSGWWLGLAKRSPFVMEIRDLWPDSLAAAGVGARGSPLNRIVEWLSRFLYHVADHVVVVTPAFWHELVERVGVPQEKVSVVQNGVEIDLFKPDGASERVRQSLGLDGKFVVSYIGNIGMAHGLVAVLDAAAVIKERIPEVLFLFVGEGAERESLSRAVQGRGLSNVTFLSEQPRERIPDLIRASDVCMTLLKKAPVFETVIPTKMLEFMACGRPVILGVDGQARRILEEAEAGLFIEPENSQALALAVETLYRDEELCARLGQNGRRHVVAHFSREKTAVEYIQLLEKVVRASQRASQG